MRNLTKTIILGALFIPTISFAVTCEPEDTNCQINKAQLEALQKSGIKPSEAIEAPATEDTSSTKDKSPLATRPFIIPPATSSQSQTTEDETYENQGATVKEEAKTELNPPLNIYKPNTNIQNQAQVPEFKFQPPKLPSPPKSTTKPPTIGIKYQ